jgi:HlyD family secretion protein
MRGLKPLCCYWLAAAAMAIVLGRASGGAPAGEPQSGAPSPPVFRTATVTRGDLVATLSATGTVEPEEVVDVGAQVAGRITDFGIDPGDPDKKKRIDYGSVVHVGKIGRAHV